jgi:hypothetical protein
MNTRLYISLIPFTLSLIATGILVYLALPNGLVSQWVAAVCFGLTTLLLLCQIVYWLRQKAPPSSDSKERVDRG